MKKLNEEYFNDKEIANDDIVDDINNQSVKNNDEMFHCISLGRQANNMSPISVFTLKDIYIRLRRIVEFNSEFIDDYELWINTDYHSEEYNLSDIYAGNRWQELLNNIWEDDMLMFDIKFHYATKSINYHKFQKFMSAVISSIDKFFYDEVTYVLYDDIDIVENFKKSLIGKYNVNKEDYYPFIIEKLYVEMFGKSIKSSEIFKCNLNYTGPVHLSKKSPKRIEEFKPGDFLYVNDDNELTSFIDNDTTNDNRKVGFCLMSCDMTNKNSAVFGAMNLASHIFPDTGHSIYRTTRLCFGNYGVIVPTFDCDKTKKYSKGGEKSTQQLLDYLNKNNKDKNWKSGILTQNQDPGYCPIALAVWRYHTRGTSRGNWYIGSVSEYSNFSRDNSFLSTLPYHIRTLSILWTSVEYSDNKALVYDIVHNKRNIEYKSMYHTVLPLLKVMNK